MDPLRNLPGRSSLPPTSSADGQQAPATSGQASTHAPTQANAALRELTGYSPQRDEFELWRLQDLPSSPQPLLSEPIGATFENTLPHSWSALMEETTPNFLAGGPGAASDMQAAMPPQPSQPYIDPRMLSVFAAQHASGTSAASIDTPLSKSTSPPSLASAPAKSPVIPAALQPSDAAGPAHGKRRRRADAPTARQLAKRPLQPDAGTAQQLAKRRLPDDRIESPAASGNLDPATRETRSAGKPIVCPTQVLHNLSRNSTCAEQLRHHECVGQTGIRAVTEACAKQEGTLVPDFPPRTYKFENVVLKAGTRVGHSKSAVLAADQCIHAVYLQLQRGKDGTDELKDLHIHVPETQPGKYCNTKESILTGNKSHQGEAQREAKQRVAAYREKNPPPEYTFQNLKKMNSTFKKSKALFQELGYHYAHELDQMLRDCKDVLGHLPREGKNELTLSRKGKTVEVLWVFENGKTADLNLAEDKEKLQKKINLGEKSKTGKEENALLLAAGDTTWTNYVIGRIARSHAKKLQELGWTDPKQHNSAVREISLHCDRARTNPKEGERVSERDNRGVEQFKLTGIGPAKKDVQGLRWVEGEMLREIKFFEDGGQKDAMEEMKKFITSSWGNRKQ